MFALRKTVVALSYIRAVFTQVAEVFRLQPAKAFLESLSGKYYVGVYPIVVR